MQTIYIAKSHSTDPEGGSWVMGVFDSFQKAKEAIELWFNQNTLPYYPGASVEFEWHTEDNFRSAISDTMYVRTADEQLDREHEHYYTVTDYTINAPIPR